LIAAAPSAPYPSPLAPSAAAAAPAAASQLLPYQGLGSARGPLESLAVLLHQLLLLDQQFDQQFDQLFDQTFDQMFDQHACCCCCLQGVRKPQDSQ
jgi:hypothetical protein